MEKKSHPSNFFGLIRQNLSQCYRGKCMRWMRAANDRYQRDNDNLSCITAVRGVTCARIKPDYMVTASRDEIFILPAGEAPPSRRNETTTAPIDSAIYQLILSAGPRRCVPVTNSCFNHVQRAILS